MKCGHCKGDHETVAEVRECSGVRVVPGGEAERYLRNQQSLADGERDAEDMRAYRRTAGVGEREATPKMVKWVRDIIAGRVVPPTVAEEVEELMLGNRLAFNTARRFINDYKDAPRRPREVRSDMAGLQGGTATAVATDLVDGMYRNPATGDIFKIYHTVHGANEQVAKRLRVLPEDERFTKVVRGKEVEVRAEFVYMGKRGLAGLTLEMRMTLEDAEKYGAIYGVCIRCSATLTKEESIARAMGDTCAAKSNWA